MPETPAGKLLDTVIDIAKSAPKRQSSTAWGAIISWRLIHQLRQQLDDMGIEWRRDA